MVDVFCLILLWRGGCSAWGVMVVLHCDFPIKLVPIYNTFIGLLIGMLS